MAELTNCKTCKKEISKTASTCPHCGEGLPGIDIKCSQCGSACIGISQKGFGLGKAAVGAILLGPVGLLGGMVGRKKLEIVCQKCGHKGMFDPQSLE